MSANQENISLSISSLERIKKSIVCRSDFLSLYGKTQLIPYPFRREHHCNRWAHSLDVYEVVNVFSEEMTMEAQLLCQIGALLHDIGHPPFGHVGERVLNEIARDVGGFESNAQSVRMTLKNMQFPLMIALLCLKHKNVIPETQARQGIIKGIYREDAFILCFDKFFSLAPIREVIQVSDKLSYSITDLKDLITIRGDAFVRDLCCSMEHRSVIDTILCHKTCKTIDIVNEMMTSHREFMLCKSSMHQFFSDVNRRVIACLDDMKYLEKEASLANDVLSSIYDSLLEQQHDPRKALDYIAALDEKDIVNKYHLIKSGKQNVIHRLYI
ncbi:HD domain-containing protein [Photobacterium galatheae]|uniref:HD/PDEase domain-containing protein n=1 Tax=Photobacterium galatheae TaxID=1654360 RepID=A0A066RNI6_9GAMM|nr:HD domain-containing protein [Photobacterium galatheae]KDM92025.1 hypothetical protein EA58_08400 [Photobacterium galatheae]MCM0151064.1 HD domain-containing protein [Photobacterium galatheae]